MKQLACLIKCSQCQTQNQTIWWKVRGQTIWCMSVISLGTLHWHLSFLLNWSNINIVSLCQATFVKHNKLCKKLHFVFFCLLSFFINLFSAALCHTLNQIITIPWLTFLPSAKKPKKIHFVFFCLSFFAECIDFCDINLILPGICLVHLSFSLLNIAQQKNTICCFLRLMLWTGKICKGIVNDKGLGYSLLTSFLTGK